MEVEAEFAGGGVGVGGDQVAEDDVGGEGVVEAAGDSGDGGQPGFFLISLIFELNR